MSEIIDRFLKLMEEKHIVFNYIQLRKNGAIVGDWKRLLVKTRLNTWSASKSFISVAVGVARDEGLLSLDEHICDIFPEYVPANPSENLTGLTLKHMLTMTTGLTVPLFFTNDRERVETRDWAKHFFNAEFSLKPGERYLYSNFNTYMLSRAVERRAGCDMLEYMRTRIFEPLDILSPDWTRDPMGFIHAANGLYVTIDEFANFGEMVLNGGAFRGKRIVSEAYIREACSLHSKGEKDSEGEWGYGYQFWLLPDGVSTAAVGRYGQFVMILPERNAVVATQGLDDYPFNELMMLVWHELAEKL